MAFKKALPFFLSILLVAEPCLLLLAQDLEGEPSGLDSKSNTELIAAERALRERMGKEPGNIDLYLELSAVYATLFDRTRKKSAQSDEWLTKSAEVLERAVMLKPGHKAALYNLGVVYKRQGQMERAREELRKAMRACDPMEDGRLLTAIWMQMGSVYEEQGFYDEAKEAYEKALEYDYGNDDIRNALEDLKERKAAAASGGSASSYNVTPGMSGASFGPTARSYDPMSGADTQPQGLAQAIPALGSMLSQKFSGQQSDQDDNGPQC